MQTLEPFNTDQTPDPPIRPLLVWNKTQARIDELEEELQHAISDGNAREEELKGQVTSKDKDNARIVAGEFPTVVGTLNTCTTVVVQVPYLLVPLLWEP